jgi:hypothetical protein
MQQDAERQPWLQPLAAAAAYGLSRGYHPGGTGLVQFWFGRLAVVAIAAAGGTEDRSPAGKAAAQDCIQEAGSCYMVVDGMAHNKG